MIKAKDYWDFLCNDVGIRFFAGLPVVGNTPLYDTMSSDFMFYLPAANERVALGIVNGARLAGVKSGLLLGSNLLRRLHADFEDFGSCLDSPILIITDSDFELSFLNLPIHRINSKNYTKFKDGIVIPEKGFTK
jgi:hypothetical protein